VRPPQPVSTSSVRSSPVYASVSRSWGGNADSYYARRTTVYTSYRTSYPSVFIVTHNMYPNYGMYDSGFLTGMFMGYLGSSMVQNAAWLAAQQNEAWYASYRADLDRQAIDNQELREKLAAMDAEIARQRAAGNVAQAGSLPDGVDPALAVAPEAVNAVEPEKEQQSSGGGVSWIWVVVGVIVGAVVAFFVLASIARSR